MGRRRCRRDAPYQILTNVEASTSYEYCTCNQL